MKITNTIRTLLGVGLLCGAGLAVQADDTVTFQVDMSRYTNAAGAQMATVVDVRGNFAAPLPNWSAGMTLVNNGANIYTNTFTVVGAPASTIAYKYTFQYWSPGVNWEDDNPPVEPGQPANTGNDRTLLLGGGTQTLPVTPLYRPSTTTPLPDAPLVPVNPVFFQVDMSGITNSSGGLAFSIVDVRGNFTGWGGGSTLVAAGGGIYTNTFDLAAMTPGQATSWKFTFTAANGVNWEDSIGGTNRSFLVAGGPALQTLPLVPFYAPSIGLPLEFVTNAVTFQVDMQVQGVQFIVDGGAVGVSGSFNGWGNTALTNNSSATPPLNWIYSGTISNIIYQKYFPNFTPAQEWSANRYKFRANGGWEEPGFSTIWNSNDRAWSATNSGPTMVLPVVLYSDATLCDILAVDTTVVFSLHITNGTMTTSGHPFDSALDTIHINGASLYGTWFPWDGTTDQLLPVGGDIYQTAPLLIPAGRPRNQIVKYGILFPGNVGNIDNENISQKNHLQWIRSTNAAVTMSTVEFGTNFNSTLVQQRFGNLKAGAPSGGNVPISWLGCGCVTLQTKSDLGSTWINLPETDGQSLTNVPNSGTKFFRLYNRPIP